MPNLFSAIFEGAKDSIDSPLKVARDLKHGDFKGAFTDLKHMPGNQERKNSDILASVGVRGKVGQNPIVIPAAIFGGIYGAAAMGAGGAGAAGGSAGAAGAGTAGTGASALGGAGASAYMAPAASGGVASGFTPAMLTTQGAAAAQAGGAMGAAAPSTSALLGMGQTGMAGGGMLSGTSAGSAAGLGQFSTSMLGKEGATSAITSSGGQVPASYSGNGSSWADQFKGNNLTDNINNMSQVLKSVQQPEEQRVQGGGQMAPAPRTGFNFDRKSFENPLLTKTYSELYNSPTFKVPKF